MADDDDRRLPSISVADERRRLDGILTAFEYGCVVTDADFRVLWMSPGTIETYGPIYSVGSDAYARIHPDDLARTQRLVKTAIAHPRQKVRGSIRVSSELFPDVWWQIDGTMMALFDEPSVGGLVVTFGPHADVGDGDGDGDGHGGGDGGGREGAAVTGAMRMSDVMPAGLVQATGDGDCYYRNRLAVAHLGDFSLGEPAAVWMDRARPEDSDALRQALKEALAGHRSEPVVARFPALGGHTWLRIEFTPQFDGRGMPAGWIATSLDVTAEIEAREELHRAQEHLWHLANHDALTGLPNRPAVLDRLGSALALERRERHGVALLFCDLDGFKPVNDRYGHESGDEVLRAVAARMQEAVRDTDTVGRLGGDEFVVLCESFDRPEDVHAVAQRLRDLVVQPLDLAAPGHEVVVDVTVGLAIAEPDDTSSTLLARADASMYDRKAARRRAAG